MIITTISSSTSVKPFLFRVDSFMVLPSRVVGSIQRRARLRAYRANWRGGIRRNVVDVAGGRKIACDRIGLHSAEIGPAPCGYVEWDRGAIRSQAIRGCARQSKGVDR